MSDFQGRHSFGLPSEDFLEKVIVELNKRSEASKASKAKQAKQAKRAKQSKQASKAKKATVTKVDVMNVFRPNFKGYRDSLHSFYYNITGNKPVDFRHDEGDLG